MPKYKKPGRPKNYKKYKEIRDFAAAKGTNPSYSNVAHVMKISKSTYTNAYKHVSINTLKKEAKARQKKR